jgi:hypothetical protein
MNQLSNRLPMASVFRSLATIRGKSSFSTEFWHGRADFSATGARYGGSFLA